MSKAKKAPAAKKPSAKKAVAKAPAKKAPAAKAPAVHVAPPVPNCSAQVAAAQAHGVALERGKVVRHLRALAHAAAREGEGVQHPGLHAEWQARAGALGAAADAIEGAGHDRPNA